MDLYLLECKLAEFNWIESKRLVLRPFAFQDGPDLFNFANDIENMKYVFPPLLTLADTELFIVRNFMREPLGNWAIEGKDNNKLIGLVHITTLNKKEQTAEIGFLLSKKYWHQGLMTEALQTLLYFCFQEFQLKAVNLMIDEENRASLGLAQKLGFHIGQKVKGKNQNTNQMHIYYKCQLNARDYQE